MTPGKENAMTAYAAPRPSAAGLGTTATVCQQTFEGIYPVLHRNVPYRLQAVLSAGHGCFRDC